MDSDIWTQLVCIIDTPVAYRFSLIVMYVYLSDRVRRIRVGQSESVHECRSPCSQQRPRPTRVKTAPTVKRAPSSVVPVDTEQHGQQEAATIDLLGRPSGPRYRPHATTVLMLCVIGL